MRTLLSYWFVGVPAKYNRYCDRIPGGRIVRAEALGRLLSALLLTICIVTVQNPVCGSAAGAYYLRGSAEVIFLKELFNFGLGKPDMKVDCEGR